MGRARTWQLPRADGVRLGEPMVHPGAEELARLRSLAAELRFWEKVSAPDARGCMLWLGSRNTVNGYGQFNPTGTGGTTTAHRWAWTHWRGPVPDGMHVCHVCDVRTCVNVEHLFVGTPRENVHDKLRKGRQPMKFSDAQIAEIRMRSLAGERPKAIREAFGITDTYLRTVLRGGARRVPA